MKNITGGATKFTRLIIPLTALLLATGAAPTVAGILDTINSKVTTIQNRTSTILSNTNGVQDVVSNVRGMSDGFRPEVLDNLRGSLSEAQDLIEFIRSRQESAGSPMDYPDLSSFISSLESVVNGLLDDPNNELSFGILTSLLQVLPDRLLAGLGRAVSKAGIDGAFIDRIDQAASDLEVLRDALRQDAIVQTTAAQGPQVNADPPVPGLDRLPFPTNCDRFNSNRVRLVSAATTMSLFGASMKVKGEMLAGAAETFVRTSELQVWGWVGAQVWTDPDGATGKIVAGIGDGLLQTANAVINRLRHCEILYRQAEIMETNQQVLDSNQQVMDGNAALLEEVCRLTRYRSANCQALLP